MSVTLTCPRVTERGHAVATPHRPFCAPTELLVIVVTNEIHVFTLIAVLEPSPAATATYLLS